MVDRYEIAALLGAVIAVSGVGFIYTISPIAAIGASFLVVGVLTVVVAFLQKVLVKLNMSLIEIL